MRHGPICKGDVVVLAYPFSDLTNSKRHPAVVIASAGGVDLILCQMTSHPGQDPRALLIEPNDVKGGVFSRAGYALPTRVFTADQSIILRRVGTLTGEKLHTIVDLLVKALRGV